MNAPRASKSTPGRAAPDAGGAAARETYSISDLAHEFGITTRTIRFYESRGLIAPARVGTSRHYSKRDRARLMLILRGRNLGFTVEDVGEYLALYDSDPGQIAQTRLLLSKVTAAIAELEKKRTDIDAALGDLRQIADRCKVHLEGP
ncbi:MAG TPA: MerR family DNA-binding transcriptional regulator [Hyphomicrobium sp.]|nr:MerR family DNA-binding transcriptional regulator [Hyphomicrobium sp.]